MLESNLINNRQSIDIDIDFYGLDLKENIQLNREKLTSKGIDKVTNIIKNIVNCYQDYIFENNGKNFIENIDEYSDSSIENLWLFCDIKLKMKFSEQLNQKIANIPITVFRLNVNNKYVLDNTILNEILPLNESVYFVSIHNYKFDTIKEPKEVLEILNQIPDNIKQQRLVLNTENMHFIDNLLYKDLYFQKKGNLKVFTVYLEDELTDLKKYVINLSKESKNLMLSFLSEKKIIIDVLYLQLICIKVLL